MKLQPNIAEIHNNLGETLRRNGRIDEAIFEYFNTIRFSPDYTAAPHNLGVVYHIKGQLDEAVLECREIIKLEPENANIYIRLAEVLTENGQIAEVIKALDNFIVYFSPEYVEVVKEVKRLFDK